MPRRMPNAAASSDTATTICRSATGRVMTRISSRRPRDNRSSLLARSIGQLLKRAHKMIFTAALQSDGLSDTSSVTVKELNDPALNGSLARCGADEPAGGGGVDFAAAAGGAEQDAHAAALLGRQLQPT